MNYMLSRRMYIDPFRIKTVTFVMFFFHFPNDETSTEGLNLRSNWSQSNRSRDCLNVLHAAGKQEG